MEFIGVFAILIALGVFFYAIREPEKWNWRRPAKSPRCSVCGGRHLSIEECDLS